MLTCPLTVTKPPEVPVGVEDGAEAVLEALEEWLWLGALEGLEIGVELGTEDAGRHSGCYDLILGNNQKSY